ncbi:Terminase small subunit [uncultured Caudovirales phage]|uniref:Terminase small subunit n=1 Tax=uncultured Caudovirales phage TaxID=2100421 RepID=A0A6J5KIJ4_9CAUD|nr:Terminase small subunit [uncultured Caudovirales phage]
MLNPKHQKFVLEYLKDLNATQAAIRAGYSAKTSRVQGSRLLTNAAICIAIAERQTKVMHKLDTSAERILLERARLAFYDPGKLLDDDGRPIPLSALDEDTRRAIASVKIVTQGNTEIGLAEITEFKLADKNASLTALEKINGMYSSGDEPAGVLNIHVHV